MKKYLILENEKSAKFWKIETVGSMHRVNYGRIGTDGQTKEKDFDSAVAAKEDARRLFDSKIKKGYVESKPPSAGSKKKASKTSKTTATKSKKATTPKNKARKTKSVSTKSVSNSKLVDPIVLEDSGNLELIYQRDHEVLFLILEDDERRELEEGVSLEDYMKLYRIHRYYNIEIRRYKSKSDATKAVKTILERAKKERRTRINKPAFQAEKNIQQPGAKLPHKFQRLGEIVKVSKGPIKGQTGGVPNWLFPRPPMICANCQKPLVPVFSCVGDLDPALGKKSGVYFSVCRNSTGSSCKVMSEVVFQDSATKPKTSWYMTSPAHKEYLNFHISEQVDHKESVHFVVAMHRGTLGHAGWVDYSCFKTRDKALSHIDKLKHLHVKGDFALSKNPGKNPDARFYKDLFHSVQLCGWGGKSIPEKTWQAKRVTEGYEQMIHNFRAEYPTNGNMRYGSDDFVVAGGDPIIDHRYGRISKKVKTWSKAPYLFFTVINELESLFDPKQCMKFEIWIDPKADFGRAFAHLDF